MPAGEECSVDEYLRGEDDLPVCTDLDSDSWDTNFLSQLGQQEEQESGDESNDEPLPPPSPKIKNFKEAINSSGDIQQFLRVGGILKKPYQLVQLLIKLLDLSSRI